MASTEKLDLDRCNKGNMKEVEGNSKPVMRISENLIRINGKTVRESINYRFLYSISILSKTCFFF